MARVSDELIGRAVSEYQVTSLLHAGSSSRVYAGRQPRSEKLVAIKVLAASRTTSVERVKRFQAEARAACAIRHRGIVDVLAFGQLADGRHYMVMELLEGRGFDRLIDDEAPVEPIQALRWLEEILDALAAAHRAGIVHRDLKPSNLWLVEAESQAPSVKVLDFGIARAQPGADITTPETRDGGLSCTPAYVAPEQVTGESVSPATDLYALGCVLFELLTGHTPFESDEPFRLLWCHVEEPVPSVRELVPEIPQPVDELVAWMMAKRPSERPPSAERLRTHVVSIRQAREAEVAAEARRHVHGHETSALARSEVTRTGRPASAVVALAGAALLVAGGTWAILAGRSSGDSLALAAAEPSAAVAAAAPAMLPEPTEAAAKPAMGFESTPPAEVPPEHERTLWALDIPRENALITGFATVRGWATAPGGIERVELGIDDLEYRAIPHGSIRPDVAMALPLAYASGRSGYVGLLDASALSEGSHTLRLRAFHRHGEPVESVQPITVAHLGDPSKAGSTSVSLREARLLLDGPKLVLESVRAGLDTYKLGLLFSVPHQTFEVVDLERTSRIPSDTPPPGSAARSPVAPSEDDVLPSAELGRTHTDRGAIVLAHPFERARLSGFSTIAGWVQSPAGITEVDLYIDGDWKQRTPVLSPEGAGIGLPASVRDTRPPRRMFADLLVTMPLADGPHELVVRIPPASDGASPAEARVRFTTARLASAFIGDPKLVQVRSARLEGEQLRLDEVVVDGRRLAVTLEWSPATSRFAISSVRALRATSAEEPTVDPEAAGP